MPRILAIDYGKKRCGIAVTDNEQIIATALTTVPANELLAFLKDYLKSEQVIRFVIGEPKDLQGGITHSTIPVANFVTLLEKEFPAIPITMIDERFTSKMASQAMFMSGKSKKQRQDKGQIDQVSAVIILQDYMSRNPS
jgi:putative Holliday junction resolvase